MPKGYQAGQYAMNERDIGTAMGLTRNQVRALLFSAMQKIRRKPETLAQFERLIDEKRRLLNRRLDSSMEAWGRR